MELTPRYKGPLPAVGTDRRVREKHQIRHELSGQLAAYWEQSRRLKTLFADVKNLQIAKRSSDQLWKAAAQGGMASLFWKVTDVSLGPEYPAVEVNDEPSSGKLLHYGAV